MSKFYFFNENDYYVENDFYLTFEEPTIIDVSIRLSSAIDNLFFHFGVDIPWVNLEDAPSEGVIPNLIDPSVIVKTCNLIITLLENESNPVINKIQNKTEHLFVLNNFHIGEEKYLNNRLIDYLNELKKLSSDNLFFVREM